MGKAAALFTADRNQEIYDLNQEMYQLDQDRASAAYDLAEEKSEGMMKGLGLALVLGVTMPWLLPGLVGGGGFSLGTMATLGKMGAGIGSQWAEEEALAGSIGQELNKTLYDVIDMGDYKFDFSNIEEYQHSYDERNQAFALKEEQEDKAFMLSLVTDIALLGTDTELFGELSDEIYPEGGLKAFGNPDKWWS